MNSNKKECEERIKVNSEVSVDQNCILKEIYIYKAYYFNNDLKLQTGKNFHIFDFLHMVV